MNVTCECERTNSVTLAQRLHLLNSAEVQTKLTSANSRAGRLAANLRPESEKIKELYLWAFARYPTADELQTVEKFVARKSAAAQGKRQAYEDIFWALINSSVVTLDLGGWDTHKDNFNAMRKLLPELDHAIHALVTDLHARGLDKDVALLVCGEFGRTPKINGGAGGDHWPAAGFALLAGGGQTDAHGGKANGVPYTSQHLLATLYHVLGIDPATAINDHNGRPVHLLDQRDPINELL